MKYRAVFHVASHKDDYGEEDISEMIKKLKLKICHMKILWKHIKFSKKFILSHFHLIDYDYVIKYQNIDDKILEKLIINKH